MAITVSERFIDIEQDTGDQGQSEKRYTVFGTDVSTEAMAAMWAEAPTSVDALGDGSVIHHRHSVSGWKRVNNDCWQGSVIYRPTNWQYGVATMSGSAGGGTQHITHSLATTVYPDNAAAIPVSQT